MSAMNDRYADVFEGVEPDAKVFWSFLYGENPDELDVGCMEEVARNHVKGDWVGVIFHGQSFDKKFIAFSTGATFNPKWKLLKRVSSKSHE